MPQRNTHNIQDTILTYLMNPQVTKVLELLDEDFEAAIITILSWVKENILLMHEK